jgi:DNA-binding GntR family transcriptional regulator
MKTKPSPSGEGFEWEPMLSSSLPRYRQLTDQLRAAIVSGEYPVGSLLPTELEISRNFGVSRHTVRDALRILSTAGLIERRRRVGTIVTKTSEPEEFVQPLPGLDEVLLYGRDIKLDVDSYDMPLACALAREFALRDNEWMRIDGRRGPETRLIGVTTALVRRDFAPAKAALLGSDGSLGALVEARGAAFVAKIDQEISAIAIDRGAAHKLGVAVASPALRARRLYYGAADILFLLTESIHPADRFSYKLSFARGGPEQTAAL